MMKRFFLLCIVFSCARVYVAERGIKEPAPLWSYKTGDWVDSSPSIADIDNDGKLEVVVGSRDYKIYALNGEDGSLLWSYATGSDVSSSPSIADIDNDGKLEVVVGSNDDNIYALNGEDGSLLWSYTTGNGVYSSPSIADIDNDGKLEVVIGSCDRKIYALNGEDGSILWSYTTGNGVYSSPSIADIDNDGKLEVVVGSDDYKIYALNGKDGSVLWSYKTGYWVRSSPSIADIDNDGKLEVVFGSYDSKIYTLSTGYPVPALSLLPWTKFKQNAQNTGSFLAAPRKVPVVKRLSPFLTMKLMGITDENGDKRFEGLENIRIQIEVSNNGKGDAKGVLAKVDIKGEGFSYSTSKTLGDLKAGDKILDELRFTMPADTGDGSCRISVDVRDSSGSRAENLVIEGRCSRILPPRFSIYGVIDDDMSGSSSGNGNGRIEKGETIELKLNIKNDGNGMGKDVVLSADGEGIEFIEKEARVGNIPSFSSAEAKITFFVPGDYRGDSVNITLKLSEKTGLFPFTTQKSYPVYERVITQRIDEGGVVKTLPSLAIWGIEKGMGVPDSVNTDVLWDVLSECATRSGGFNVLTKENVWSTLKDRGEKVEKVWERCTEAICLVDYGRVLQADYIIGSKLDLFKDTYIFALSIYDVKSSSIKKKVIKQGKPAGFSEFQDLLNSACEELLGMK